MGIRKTVWEQVYSFFGFWTYIFMTGEERKHRILYWSCPWFGKFDLIKWRIYD